jgi:hypothetical protein
MTALATRAVELLRRLWARVSSSVRPSSPIFDEPGIRGDVVRAMVTETMKFYVALTPAAIELLGRAHRQRPGHMLTEAEQLDVIKLRDRLWSIVDAAEAQIPGIGSAVRLLPVVEVPTLTDKPLAVPNFYRP